MRNGLVESSHAGAVVALAPDGATALAAGDVRTPVFPRSSNKPLQVVGMLRAGLGDVLDRHPDPTEALAIASASHSGEPEHLAAVRRLLAAAGLAVDALANTPALPLDEAAAHALLRSGGGPDALHQNCSGKHAAMLATCLAAGWPVAGYCEPGHPLQQALEAAVADLAGEPVAATGVDGCGAALFAVSLTGLARAFSRLVLAAPGTPERRVADAMRAQPDLVGGTGRDVTGLMRAVPGLLAKDGAEGVYAAALADGTALALKVADGSGRARPPVVVATLRALGVGSPALDAVAATPVLGGGRPVGEVRALPLLSART